MTDHSPGDRYCFWIDRGGTFTDIVARCPDGSIVVHKLLSENPELYADAPLQGIRDILGIASDAPIPGDRIAEIKMGTTVATNALLERKGDRVVLLISKGFGDALRIGYQNRPDIFALKIVLPEMLYERVIEVNQRYSAQGEELVPLELDFVASLQMAYDHGIRACAIVLMHSYRYPDRELQVAAIARQIGFNQVSVSHQVSPLMKLIGRGDTTVLDAYLSPILRRYIDRLTVLTEASPSRLMFMQSNGGLTEARSFQGKDSLLSGPAAGIVGAAQTSLEAGFDKIISFDMGGTSTDVAHYRGEYERVFETEVAGVRLRTPMLAIHTVAAGGGSIVAFDGDRYRVGPESAGAEPGPACYRRGGPLTITDCNVMLGKLHPEFFPQVFGSGNLPLDKSVVYQKFAVLAAQIQAQTGDGRTPAAVAQGFIAIAVTKMADAIKKISLVRGHDVSDYTLCCFGGAGGQHACQIADALGIKQIFIHAYAGVLSAYGMGLAERRTIREHAVEARLTEALLPQLQHWQAQLLRLIRVSGDRDYDEDWDHDCDHDADKSPFQAETGLEAEVAKVAEVAEIKVSLRLRYEGTDTALSINLDGNELDCNWLRAKFEELHCDRYGLAFTGRELLVEAIAVEIVSPTERPAEPIISYDHVTPAASTTPIAPIAPIAQVQMYCTGSGGLGGSMATAQWQSTPVFSRDKLQPGNIISSPALIVDATGTNVIEMGWQAELSDRGDLIVRRISDGVDSKQQLQPDPEQSLHGDSSSASNTIRPDPVLLEIFNNLFRAIAEQMGVTLQHTSYSVNIKERLDFSCAIFDSQGQLVANAPHIPVHLGSMGASVEALIQTCGDVMQPGDAYALNNPYNGGTHLPDITVITPIFDCWQNSDKILFYVASRGHHADIGGITPGSMPSHSTSIEQEGVLIDNFKVMAQGQFREAEILALLTSEPYPVRNPTQNIADLQAQVAANACGVKELHDMVARYGLKTVQAYMGYVQDNAEASVRRAIAKLCQPQQEQAIAVSNTSSALTASDSVDIVQYPVFTYPLDNGSQIQVAIALNASQHSAVIDFTGTSPQQVNNFNAPLAICKAAVLYVFRTLVNDDIPLNAGCLKPLEIIVPPGTMLNPCPPAAVVAGNVETSQAIVNALYGALGAIAAAQGTMNNLTFGNANYQYYETICGGSGAGQDFDGTDAVQTHMTNSRLTDPEVLEWRFPVVLEHFAIRPHSGGNGDRCGGNGVVRRLRFREPMTASILSNHRRIPPFGLCDGEPGATGHNWLERSNGELVQLDSAVEVELQAGDALIIKTPGGGGYHAPAVIAPVDETKLSD